MRVPYKKMHGTGNVILVVDQRRQNLPPPSAAEIRELGSEDTGPGFDQMMWIYPSESAATIAAYRVFNADGSEVEQCGNGVRCVARHLSSVEDDLQAFTLASPAGPVAARVAGTGTIAVDMGTPQFEPSRIPFVADRMADSYSLQLADDEHAVSVVSMGNPHCVLQVDDVTTAPVDVLGPQIEHHDRFPQRANVGFMHVVDRHTVDLRVHERGVGETAACGTGACAAVACGQRLGLLDERVTVRLPGGEVVVSWRGDESAAWLEGDAELVSEGIMDLKE